MTHNDRKRLLDWFRRQRLNDEYGAVEHDGWRFKHDIPERTEEEGLFTPRMRDRDVRDLAELGYLETRQVGKLKQWRYIPRPEQEPKVMTDEEILQHALL